MDDLKGFIDESAKRLWDALGPLADALEQPKAGKSCPECGVEMICDSIDMAHMSIEVFRCAMPGCYYYEAVKDA